VAALTIQSPIVLLLMTLPVLTLISRSIWKKNDDSKLNAALAKVLEGAVTVVVLEAVVVVRVPTRTKPINGDLLLREVTLNVSSILVR
jgi:hypothetical protein